jgi:tRNA-dihydrouridine synthase B
MPPLPSVSPVQIGPVTLDFPFALAALSGYSDLPTRVMARRAGAGYTVCEVMLDRFIVHVSKGKKARRYLQVSDEDHPTAAQLMGSSADEFVPAALKMVEVGFDVVDINFGCPVKKVVGKCRGGWMLSRPDLALEIVGRVRDAAPGRVPVTLKMRRGLDDSAESRDRFFEIFDGAWARGAAAVTVHGRTVRQRYDGPSSWDFLREVKAHAGRRVVFGSGDLFTAAACFDMIARTGVDGVTVARGAIGNPWIFRELRALAAGNPLPPPPTVQEQRAWILEHYRLAESLLGSERAAYVVSGHGIKYARMHPQFEQVRAAFATARRPDRFLAVLAQWYA